MISMVLYVSIYVSHESKHRLLLLLPLIHGFLLGQLSVMSSSLEGWPVDPATKRSGRCACRSPAGKSGSYWIQVDGTWTASSFSLACSASLLCIRSSAPSQVEARFAARFSYRCWQMELQRHVERIWLVFDGGIWWCSVWGPPTPSLARTVGFRCLGHGAASQSRHAMHMPCI